MLRAASYSRYAVKLKINLPRGQVPVPVLPRSFSSTATLCEALLRDCQRPDPAERALVPWQRVRHMQIVSIHNVLGHLARCAGVTQIERFFESVWNPTGPVGRTKGRGRAGRRGQNLPNNRSLASLEERLATVYEGRRWPLQVDCYQLLWLSLLIDRPILGSAEELLEAHHSDPDFRNSTNILTMGLPILETGSKWKFGLWVGLQHVSLPYLAGCIVVMRVCAEKGQSRIAHDIAEVLCQLLAMLGPELQDRGIGAAMLRYCTEHILPIGCVHTTPERIAHAAAMLNLAALVPQAADDARVEWEVRMRVMAEILWGTYDSRLQYFCDPIALSMPWQLLAKWTRSLRKSRFRRKGSRVQTEAYLDRIIDMPELFARVPALTGWMRSDPRFVPTKPSASARQPSWCAGLSDMGAAGNWVESKKAGTSGRKKDLGMRI